ncbi:unnamed protein product [Urochloa humidicola]
MMITMSLLATQMMWTWLSQVWTHSTVEEDQQEDLINWIRPGVEGIGGDASDIENAVPMDEPDHDSLPDDPDEDDTYIGDGVVARLDGEEDDDDDFFV